MAHTNYSTPATSGHIEWRDTSSGSIHYKDIDHYAETVHKLVEICTTVKNLPFEHQQAFNNSHPTIAGLGTMSLSSIQMLARAISKESLINLDTVINEFISSRNKLSLEVPTHKTPIIEW